MPILDLEEEPVAGRTLNLEEEPVKTRILNLAENEEPITPDRQAELMGFGDPTKNKAGIQAAFGTPDQWNAQQQKGHLPQGSLLPALKQNEQELRRIWQEREQAMQTQAQSLAPGVGMMAQYPAREPTQDELNRLYYELNAEQVRPELARQIVSQEPSQTGLQALKIHPLRAMAGLPLDIVGGGIEDIIRASSEEVAEKGTVGENVFRWAMNIGQYAEPVVAGVITGMIGRYAALAKTAPTEAAIVAKDIAYAKAYYREHGVMPPELLQKYQNVQPRPPMEQLPVKPEGAPPMPLVPARPKTIGQLMMDMESGKPPSGIPQTPAGSVPVAPEAQTPVGAGKTTPEANLGQIEATATPETKLPKLTESTPPAIASPGQPPGVETPPKASIQPVQPPAESGQKKPTDLTSTGVPVGTERFGPEGQNRVIDPDEYYAGAIKKIQEKNYREEAKDLIERSGNDVTGDSINSYADQNEQGERFAAAKNRELLRIVNFAKENGWQVEKKKGQFGKPIEPKIIDDITSFRSRYISIENPKTGDTISIRVSDHSQAKGGGFSMESGERHGEADISFVLDTPESKVDLSRFAKGESDAGDEIPVINQPVQPPAESGSKLPSTGASARLKNFTESAVINRDFEVLKNDIGEKKARHYFSQVDKLINPNRNEVVEYRANGVVTKEGDHYIFNAVSQDTKNWRIAFKRDISDQFQSAAAPAESVTTPAPEPSPAKAGETAGPPLGVRNAGFTINPVQDVADKVRNILEEHTLTSAEKETVAKGKDILTQHHVRIRESDIIAKEWTKIVNAAVPNPEDQMNMVHAYQQGDKSPYYAKLSDTQKALLEMSKKIGHQLDEKAESLGITKRELKEGQRYLFQWWKGRESDQPMESHYGKFSKNLPQSKQKYHETYEAGMSSGLKPATTNIGQIQGETLKAIVRAKETRNMYKSLGDAGIVKSWRRLSQVGQTEGWVRYHDPLLDRPVAYRDDKGTTHIIRTDAAIDENLFPFWKAYRESPTYGTISKLNFATRSLKFMFSMFHPVSLAWQEAMTGRIPFKNIPRGLKLQKEMDDVSKLLYKHGLEAKGYEDFTAQHLVPGSKLIFEVIQPGMKWSYAYDLFLEKEPKLAELGLTRDELARQVVKSADSFFSGEDVKRAGLESGALMNKIYFDPVARKIWQNLFLSPTWQREHILAAKRVIQSVAGRKISSKLGMKEDIRGTRSTYLKYFGSALAAYGLANIYNYWQTKKMDGKGVFMWDNPEGKVFGIRAPYNSPEGKPMYIRPFKSIFEIPETLHSISKGKFDKLTSKFSALITAAVHQLWPEYDKYQDAGDIPRRMFDFAQDLGVPMSVGNIERIVKGKATYWDMVLPFFGMPTSTYSTPQHDLIKAYREDNEEEADRIIRQARENGQKLNVNSAWRTAIRQKNEKKTLLQYLGLQEKEKKNTGRPTRPSKPRINKGR